MRAAAGRMRCGKTIFLAVALCASGVLGDGDYYEAAGDGHAVDRQYVRTVTRVYDKTPAHRAGLLAGDLIYGIDGKRIRSETEYEFLRHYHADRGALTLNVLRGGEPQTVHIPDAEPIRRGGFVPRNPSDLFLRNLEQWGIRVGESALLSSAAPTESGDALKARGPGEPTRSGAIVQTFPARGKEAITRMQREPGHAATLWVTDLLTIHFQLCRAEFDNARNTAAKNTPRPADAAPFLVRLFDFYRRVAANPTAFDGPDGWEHYGVDLPFLATCYPYPAAFPGRPGAAFDFDPEFRELYDLVGSRDSRARRRLHRAAEQYARGAPDDATIGEQYVGRVRAALIDPGTYLAWPVDSALVRFSPSRAIVSAHLKKRLVEKPREKVLTAFALLCPSMRDDDEEPFRAAYGVLVESGHREHLMAEKLMKRACVEFARRDRALAGKYRRIVESHHREATVPRIYAHLSAVSPAFGRKMRDPVERRDLQAWTLKHLTDITRAFADPIDADRRARAVAAATDDAATDDALRDAFHVFARELAEGKRDDTDTFFSKVAARRPAGEVTDKLMMVTAENTYRRVYDQFNAHTILEGVLGASDTKHYAAASATVAGLSKDDKADTLRRARELYELAGTPPVCLLIASRLSELGFKEEAGRYKRRVRDFFKALMECVRSRGYGNTAYYAARTFASMPGFADTAAGLSFSPNPLGRSSAYTLTRHLPRYESSYLLAAAMAYHAGEANGFIRQLARAENAHEDRVQPQLLYRGEVFSDVQTFRRVLLNEAAANEAFAVMCGGRLENFLARLNGRPRQLLAVPQTTRRIKGNRETPPAPVAVGPTRYVLRMANGASHIGTCDEGELTMHTRQRAGLPLRLRDIRTMTRDSDGGYLVVFRNGDKLRGQVNLESVTIETRDGALSLKDKTVRSIMRIPGRQ